MMLNSIFSFFIKNFLFWKKRTAPEMLSGNANYNLIKYEDIPAGEPIGIITGSGEFPFLFVKAANSMGHGCFAICHENETDQAFTELTKDSRWIKLGQLGSLISYFKENKLRYVVFAGGISRVKHFGDVKLDARGASLILKLRSTKDDVIMRGITNELWNEGITVLPCTIFMKEFICPLGVLTDSEPSEDENSDIEVGISAISAMSSQDIGQLVVVREGVVTAVEAVEGTNEAIKRGSQLGRKNVVVVKFAKATQDMRFDVPTVGLSTFKLLKESNVRVLALEAGRSVILNKEECLKIANESNISVVGVKPLVSEILS